MDEELKQLLKENIELAKQNQEIMNKISRFQQFSVIWGVVKWTVIILSTIGVFYYLQPILSSLLGTYTGLINGNSGAGSVSELKSLLGQ